MKDLEFIDLVMRYQDGVLTPVELATLEQDMSLDATKRQLFAETLVQATALSEQFRQDAYRVTPPSTESTPPKRTLNAQLAAVGMLSLGLLIGLVGSRVVAAMSAANLVVTTESLAILHDGSFETKTDVFSEGFPLTKGVWSGDRVELLNGGAKHGDHRLRFVKAESDSQTPTGPAIACDLFQLIDLRELARRDPRSGSSLLELSAEFLDDRPTNTNPSVTFFCQIYLFRGDLTKMHESWPSRISEAVSSGSAEDTTLGGGVWQSVAAKCLVSDEADFAVIHIAARPNLRGPMPDDLFVDDIKLTLKTRPSLPERNVER